MYDTIYKKNGPRRLLTGSGCEVVVSVLLLSQCRRFQHLLEEWSLLLFWCTSHLKWNWKSNSSTDKSLISCFHQNSGRTNLGCLNMEIDSYRISACFVTHKCLLLGYAFQLVRKWFSTVHRTNVYTGFTRAKQETTYPITQRDSTFFSLVDKIEGTKH